MKKIIRHFRVRNIDVLVYRMINPIPDFSSTLEENIEKHIDQNKRVSYHILHDKKVIHQSNVFNKLNVLSQIGKSGPAIGECVTHPNYRGKGIYPYVIHFVAAELLRENPEVFIIVDRTNTDSIKGILKAGFTQYAQIRAKRFLGFYFNRQIHIS